MADHARKVRIILDRGGLNDTTIFASSNIDEYKLAELMAQQAPIDGFGIGTHMDTSADAPYLDCAYKLQEYAGIARRKRSEGKATWPGRKQVYRNYDDNGIMSRDTVTVENAPCAGQPLLQLVMQGGKTVARQPTLIDARAQAQRQLNAAPCFNITWIQISAKILLSLLSSNFNLLNFRHADRHCWMYNSLSLRIVSFMLTIGL